MKIFLRSSVLLIVLVRRVGDGDGKLSTPLRFLSLRRLFLFQSNVHNSVVIMAIWFPFWRHFLIVTGGYHILLLRLFLRADVPSIRVHRMSQREVGGGLYRIVVRQYTGKSLHFVWRYMQQLLSSLLYVILEFLY